MNLFLQYIKQRRRDILMGGSFCIIFMVSFSLYRLPLKAVLYPAFLCLFLSLVWMVLDFRRIKNKHQMLESIHSLTDVITGSFPHIDSIADADYQQILQLISEEQNTYRTAMERQYSDMIDYYTVWVHQIKTPIASMRLHLQNEDSALSRKLSTDLFRVEQYVEMVLTFLRLDSQSTDYVIREYNLDTIIKQAVKNLRGNLSTGGSVLTMSRWPLQFLRMKSGFPL